MNFKFALAGVALAAASLSSTSSYAESKSAYFAGGCFWCIEKDFEAVKGVSEVQSGYQGGKLKNPTYKNHPGFLEVVKIDYNSDVVNYATLLKIFLRSVNPTDAGGQFCDRGPAYTTAVFAQTDEEKALAAAAISEAQAALGKKVVTPIKGFAPFYKSEDYHQNYYKKNPIRYNFYRNRCGRDSTVKKLWGKEAYIGIKKPLSTS